MPTTVIPSTQFASAETEPSAQALALTALWAGAVLVSMMRSALAGDLTASWDDAEPVTKTWIALATPTNAGTTNASAEEMVMLLAWEEPPSAFKEPANAPLMPIAQMSLGILNARCLLVSAFNA